MYDETDMQDAGERGYVDEWIPCRPGTDAALMLAVSNELIKQNLVDQEFLDKYCVGFDAEHMPEGFNAQDNFKDYVLGTYDNEPKTPEWAESICTVSAAKIREIAKDLIENARIGETIKIQ